MFNASPQLIFFTIIEICTISKNKVCSFVVGNGVIDNQTTDKFDAVLMSLEVGNGQNNVSQNTTYIHTFNCSIGFNIRYTLIPLLKQK
jgi:hypothetical protein